MLYAITALCCLFIVECYYAWKCFAFHELERCAAASGDVIHAISQVELLSCCSRVAAADNRVTSCFCTCLCNSLRTVRERLDFEYAHWSVPYNELRVFDNFAVDLARFRTDVDAFPLREHAVN